MSALENPSFETSLAELEAVVHDLEEGHLGLAEALDRYEQGVRHLKRCHELLTQAERKIELLAGVADDGKAITQPLDDAESSPQAGRRRARKPSRSAPPLQSAPSDDDIDDSAAGT